MISDCLAGSLNGPGCPFLLLGLSCARNLMTHLRVMPLHQRLHVRIPHQPRRAGTRACVATWIIGFYVGVTIPGTSRMHSQVALSRKQLMAHSDFLRDWLRAGGKGRSESRILGFGFRQLGKVAPCSPVRSNISFNHPRAAACSTASEVPVPSMDEVCTAT